MVSTGAGGLETHVREHVATRQPTTAATPAAGATAAACRRTGGGPARPLAACVCRHSAAWGDNRPARPQSRPPLTAAARAQGGGAGGHTAWDRAPRGGEGARV